MPFNALSDKRFIRSYLKVGITNLNFLSRYPSLLRSMSWISLCLAFWDSHTRTQGLKNARYYLQSQWCKKSQLSLIVRKNYMGDHLKLQSKLQSTSKSPEMLLFLNNNTFTLVPRLKRARNWESKCPSANRRWLKLVGTLTAELRSV